MGILHHLRIKSRTKARKDNVRPCSPTRSSFFPNPTIAFPQTLLCCLLAYVSPHVQDGSYTNSEESQIEAGCILCDMRDLAQCALVNRQWAIAAQRLLYQEVRLDSVHYCERESGLVARRSMQSYSSHTSIRDPAKERLQLFASTVREHSSLADLVQSLKIPYMTRQTAKAELAKTVSVLPNLKYVDLPDGLFCNNATLSILREELLARCPNLRWMRYAAGAEEAFVALGERHHWRRLEELELHQLVSDAPTLVRVLSSLPYLCALQLKGLPQFSDEGLLLSAGPVSFPSLTKLQLCDLPSLTSAGLIGYLSRHEVGRAMVSMTLSNTGVEVSSLHAAVGLCHQIQALYVIQSTSRPFPITTIPYLKSSSLRTLHYEISMAASHSHSALQSLNSYYFYLAKSVLSGSLPALSELYALSDQLPSLLEPTAAMLRLSGGAADDLLQLAYGFTQKLNLYTKSVSELEWNVTIINPPSTSALDTIPRGTRPMSLAYPPPLSPQWRDTARKSVVVGNGFGGYLTVPDQSTMPVSPGKKSPRKDSDAWMG